MYAQEGHSLKSAVAFAASAPARIVHMEQCREQHGAHWPHSSYESSQSVDDGPLTADNSLSEDAIDSYWSGSVTKVG